MTPSAPSAGQPLPRDVVARVLDDVAAVGPFFALAVGGPDDGWHPVGDTYARGAADLVAATAGRYGTAELRVGASLVQFGHASRLWSPVLACVLLHGVVPDLTRLQRADDGPALRLPVPAGRAAPAAGRLPEVLYDAVVTRHLEPLAAGLRVKVAAGLLYGNAASALVGAAAALRAARPALGDPLTRLTEALLATGRLAGTGVLTGPGPAFRRRSCCLYYRVPGGGLCGDCSLRV
ncbi:(2Fe-2S)-binding protein [Streptomyces sp. WMMC500]|uniref:(2Fe-2S)-binding protein n=1 Tax=Streptomyces sp. WMMC500 TaxID=3015154 RepID=UPI00248C99C6|nr:(2Fe-2S)-binding protein [Streptomyces sp. WMMC500]WBB58112.1 (2Fe-2S)-binding protein [Streptomyces sp. WMMC500]